jgi:hypothetical protein
VDVGALEALPPAYWDVPYAGARYPGAARRGELHLGANCQMWAYEVLDHFGRAIPDLRSAELWADTAATRVVVEPEPLDLVLYNASPDPYAAHVGIWTGSAVAHLCREVGRPTVWADRDFRARARYAVRIGFKRPVIAPE